MRAPDRIKLEIEPGGDCTRQVFKGELTMHEFENQLDSGNQVPRKFDPSTALLGDIWSHKSNALPEQSVTPNKSATESIPELVLTGFSEVADKGSSSPEDQQVTNDRLITQLGSSSFHQRDAATRELETRGVSALPELLRNTDHSDLEVRRRVAQVIDRIGTAGLPIMTAALDGNDAQQRVGAERSIARLSTESILDYVSENNTPERIAQARRALSNREGWQDDVSRMITRDSETGRFGPSNAQEFRRAVAGAELLDNHASVFHISLEAGRFLLANGNHQEGLNTLDRSLDTLDRRLANDPAYVLYAVDFQQQLRDQLESTAGQALPQNIRAAISQRIERAERLQMRRPPEEQERDGK